ncbi:MAG: 50S ribosomal protein L11 methyltransferase [Prevotella sp.]|nr:50S ribosomal protein L11 methyltransferase [Prevotella sp.]
MKYFEVEFTIANRAGSPVDADTLQLLRDLLPSLVAEAGFESFEDTPQGLRGFVQTDSFDETALKEGLQQLSGLMPAASPDEGTLSVSYTVADAEDKNWNADWEREGFEPICIDNRCIIHDTLHPLPFVAQPSPLSITIDARQAFGTGNHETTRMIVGRLLNLDLQGKRVLDCGCGTGILSIVAAKCGAKEAVAYDIDEWSADNTRHNAELNQVDNIEVLLGDVHVLSHVSGVFDVVLANINRNILLQDMPLMKEVMAHGARIILSGFYVDDGLMIAEKAGELGMRLLKTSSDNNWCMLEFCTE